MEISQIIVGTVIIVTVSLLTKWLMIKKNEAIINKFLNTDDVEDFECGYGQEKQFVQTNFFYLIFNRT